MTPPSDSDRPPPGDPREPEAEAPTPSQSRLPPFSPGEPPEAKPSAPKAPEPAAPKPPAERPRASAPELPPPSPPTQPLPRVKPPEPEPRPQLAAPPPPEPRRTPPPPPDYARYGAPPPPQGVPRRVARGAPRSSGLGFLSFALLFGLALGFFFSDCGDASVASLIGQTQGPKVGVVEVIGPITDAKKVVNQLYEFSGRGDLAGVVVRIDSPGGAVGPSQEIFAAMRATSKQLPVVASMGGTAASGGFWISLGADWVFALPGTITGSIGVISQSTDLQGVAKALHFSMRTYKSGPLKDAGNSFRPVTPADREMFMSLIEDIYGQFVKTTAERRGMSEAAVRKIADGRVMTGRAALKADLIDELGTLRDAARQVILLAKARKEDGVRTSSVARERIAPPVLVYPAEDRPDLLQLLGLKTQAAVEQGLKAGVREALGAELNPAPVELR